jgi:hypothetical protein
VIATVLIWLYQGLLFHLYGASTLAVAGRLLRRTPGHNVSVPLTLVIGMAQVTALATILALFLPMDGVAAAILLACGIALVVVARPSLGWSLRRPRGADWWLVAVVLISVAFCLEAGTEAPTNPDTNAYHAQTIHWIESFPAVPGLGNLSGRLAYNSSWLLLNAAFSFSFLGLGSFRVLPGFMFVASMLQFLRGLRGLMRSDSSVANWMRVLFILAASWILRGELSAPGTDLPTILLTWILLSESVEHESSRDKDPIHEVVLAVLPAFLIVLKLSTAPLALISGYIFVRVLARREARQAVIIAIMVALILLPWIAHSVILSGYPVYPYPELDVFHLDWKVPAADVDGVRRGILGWARRPMKGWEEALALPASAWIPQWLEQRTPNQLIILALALLSPAGLLLRRSRKYFLPVISVWAALWVWFLGAPNWRFGYGVVLGLTTFAGAVILDALMLQATKRLRQHISAAAPAVVAGLLGVTVVVLFDPSTLIERTVLPLDYNPSRAVECEVDELTLYCVADEGTCSYEAFPCVPGIPRSVHARGDRFQDGFYSTIVEAPSP